MCALPQHASFNGSGPRLRSRYGIALAMTLFGLAIMAVIVFTAASIATMGSRARVQDLQSLTALYLAESGVQRACSMLESNSSWTGMTATMSNGTVTITASPISSSGGGNNAGWQVTSTSSSGSSSRTLVAYVQGDSFSKYEIFTGDATAGAMVTGQSFTGPVHTNTHFNFYGNPTFTNAVDSSNQDEQASGAPSPGYPYAPNVAGGPIYDTSQISGSDSSYVYTNNADFYHVWPGAPGGYVNPSSTSPAPNGPLPGIDPNTSLPSANFSFNGGQANMSLPTDTSAINNAPGLINIDLSTEYGQAWGDDQVNIEFHGDSNQGIIMYGAGIGYGATISGPNAGAVSYNADYSSWYGVPCIQIATNGSTAPVVNVIGSSGVWTWGVVQGQATVVSTASSTDLYNGTHNTGDIWLGWGNMQYYYNWTGNSSTPQTDKLGLVANGNINIYENPWTYELDGSLMAMGIQQNPETGGTAGQIVAGTGTIQTALWGTACGNLKFFGSNICAVTGAKGVEQGGQLTDGYMSSYVYDNRLASEPPPGFPSTGVIKVYALFDKGALSQ